MKYDEKSFLTASYYERSQCLVPHVSIPPKRISYILNKWIKNGWWEHGVTRRKGWLTADGVTVARANLV